MPFYLRQSGNTLLMNADAGESRTVTLVAATENTRAQRASATITVAIVNDIGIAVFNIPQTAAFSTSFTATILATGGYSPEENVPLATVGSGGVITVSVVRTTQRFNGYAFIGGIGVDTLTIVASDDLTLHTPNATTTLTMTILGKLFMDYAREQQWPFVVAEDTTRRARLSVYTELLQVAQDARNLRLSVSGSPGLRVSLGGYIAADTSHSLYDPAHANEYADDVTRQWGREIIVHSPPLADVGGRTTITVEARHDPYYPPARAIFTMVATAAPIKVQKPELTLTQVLSAPFFSRITVIAAGGRHASYLVSTYGTITAAVNNQRPAVTTLDFDVHATLTANNQNPAAVIVEPPEQRGNTAAFFDILAASRAIVSARGTIRSDNGIVYGTRSSLRITLNTANTGIRQRVVTLGRFDLAARLTMDNNNTTDDNVMDWIEVSGQPAGYTAAANNVVALHVLTVAEGAVHTITNIHPLVVATLNDTGLATVSNNTTPITALDYRLTTRAHYGRSVVVAVRALSGGASRLGVMHNYNANRSGGASPFFGRYAFVEIGESPLGGIPFPVATMFHYYNPPAGGAAPLITSRLTMVIEDNINLGRRVREVFTVTLARPVRVSVGARRLFTTSITGPLFSVMASGGIGDITIGAGGGAGITNTMRAVANGVEYSAQFNDAGFFPLTFTVTAADDIFREGSSDDEILTMTIIAEVLPPPPVSISVVGESYHYFVVTAGASFERTLRFSGGVTPAGGYSPSGVTTGGFTLNKFADDSGKYTLRGVNITSGITVTVLADDERPDSNAATAKLTIVVEDNFTIAALPTNRVALQALQNFIVTAATLQSYHARATGYDYGGLDLPPYISVRATNNIGEVIAPPSFGSPRTITAALRAFALSSNATINTATASMIMEYVLPPPLTLQVSLPRVVGADAVAATLSASGGYLPAGGEYIYKVTPRHRAVADIEGGVTVLRFLPHLGLATATIIADDLVRGDLSPPATAIVSAQVYGGYRFVPVGASVLPPVANIYAGNTVATFDLIANSRGGLDNVQIIHNSNSPQMFVATSGGVTQTAHNEYALRHDIYFAPTLSAGNFRITVVMRDRNARHLPATLRYTLNVQTVAIEMSALTVYPLHPATQTSGVTAARISVRGGNADYSLTVLHANTFPYSLSAGIYDIVYGSIEAGANTLTIVANDSSSAAAATTEIVVTGYVRMSAFVDYANPLRAFERSESAQTVGLVKLADGYRHNRSDVKASLSVVGAGGYQWSFASGASSATIPPEGLPLLVSSSVTGTAKVNVHVYNVSAGIAEDAAFAVTVNIYSGPIVFTEPRGATINIEENATLTLATVYANAAAGGSVSLINARDYATLIAAGEGGRKALVFAPSPFVSGGKPEELVTISLAAVSATSSLVINIIKAVRPISVSFAHQISLAHLIALETVVVTATDGSRTPTAETVSYHLARLGESATAKAAGGVPPYSFRVVPPRQIGVPRDGGGLITTRGVNVREGANGAVTFDNLGTAHVSVIVGDSYPFGTPAATAVFSVITRNLFTIYEAPTATVTADFRKFTGRFPSPVLNYNYAANIIGASDAVLTPGVSVTLTSANALWRIVPTPTAIAAGGKSVSQEHQVYLITARPGLVTFAQTLQARGHAPENLRYVVLASLFPIQFSPSLTNIAASLNARATAVITITGGAQHQYRTSVGAQPGGEGGIFEFDFAANNTVVTLRYGNAPEKGEYAFTVIARGTSDLETPATLIGTAYNRAKGRILFKESHPIFITGAANTVAVIQTESSTLSNVTLLGGGGNFGGLTHTIIGGAHHILISASAAGEASVRVVAGDLLPNAPDITAEFYIAALTGFSARAPQMSITVFAGAQSVVLGTVAIAGGEPPFTFTPLGAAPFWTINAAGIITATSAPSQTRTYNAAFRVVDRDLQSAAEFTMTVVVAPQPVYLSLQVMPPFATLARLGGTATVSITGGDGAYSLTLINSPHASLQSGGGARRFLTYNRPGTITAVLRVDDGDAQTPPYLQSFTLRAFHNYSVFQNGEPLIAREADDTNTVTVSYVLYAETEDAANSAVFAPDNRTLSRANAVYNATDDNWFVRFRYVFGLPQPGETTAAFTITSPDGLHAPHIQMLTISTRLSPITLSARATPDADFLQTSPTARLLSARVLGGRAGYSATVLGDIGAKVVINTLLITITNAIPQTITMNRRGAQIIVSAQSAARTGTVTATLRINGKGKSAAFETYITAFAFAPLSAQIIARAPIIRALPAGQTHNPPVLIGSVVASGGGGNYQYSVGVNQYSHAFSVNANGALFSNGDFDGAQSRVFLVAIDDNAPETPPVVIAYSVFARNQLDVIQPEVVSVTTGNLIPQPLITLAPGAGVEPYFYLLLNAPWYFAVGPRGAVSALITPSAPTTVTITIALRDSAPDIARATAMLTFAAVAPPPPVSAGLAFPGFPREIQLDKAPDHSLLGQTVARIFASGGGANPVYEYDALPRSHFLRVEGDGDIVIGSVAVGEVKATLIARERAGLSRPATIFATANVYKGRIALHDSAAPYNENHAYTITSSLNFVRDRHLGIIIARATQSGTAACSVCTVTTQTPGMTLIKNPNGEHTLKGPTIEGVYSLTIVASAPLEDGVTAYQPGTATFVYDIRWRPFRAEVISVRNPTLGVTDNGNQPGGYFVAAIRNYDGYGGYTPVSISGNVRVSAARSGNYGEMEVFVRTVNATTTLNQVTVTAVTRDSDPNTAPFVTSLTFTVQLQPLVGVTAFLYTLVYNNSVTVTFTGPEFGPFGRRYYPNHYIGRVRFEGGHTGDRGFYYEASVSTDPNLTVRIAPVRFNNRQYFELDGNANHALPHDRRHILTVIGNDTHPLTPPATMLITVRSVPPLKILAHNTSANRFHIHNAADFTENWMADVIVGGGMLSPDSNVPVNLNLTTGGTTTNPQMRYKVRFESSLENDGNLSGYARTRDRGYFTHGGRGISRFNAYLLASRRQSVTMRIVIDDYADVPWTAPLTLTVQGRVFGPRGAQPEKVFMLIGGGSQPINQTQLRYDGTQRYPEGKIAGLNADLMPFSENIPVRNTIVWTASAEDAFMNWAPHATIANFHKGGHRLIEYKGTLFAIGGGSRAPYLWSSTQSRDRNNTYWAMRSGRSKDVYYSVDSGVTWHKHIANSLRRDIGETNIGVMNGTLIMLGGATNGRDTTFGNNFVYESTDGLNWRETYQYTFGNLGGGAHAVMGTPAKPTMVVFGGSRIPFGVDDGYYYDRISWLRRHAEENRWEITFEWVWEDFPHFPRGSGGWAPFGFEMHKHGTGIRINNTMFVVGGFGGEDKVIRHGMHSGIYYSTDGVTWHHGAWMQEGPKLQVPLGVRGSGASAELCTFGGVPLKLWWRHQYPGVGAGTIDLTDSNNPDHNRRIWCRGINRLHDKDAGGRNWTHRGDLPAPAAYYGEIIRTELP